MEFHIERAALYLIWFSAQCYNSMICIFSFKLYAIPEMNHTASAILYSLEMAFDFIKDC